MSEIIYNFLSLFGLKLVLRNQSFVASTPISQKSTFTTPEFQLIRREVALEEGQCQCPVGFRRPALLCSERFSLLLCGSVVMATHVQRLQCADLVLRSFGVSLACRCCSRVEQQLRSVNSRPSLQFINTLDQNNRNREERTVGGAVSFTRHFCISEF